MIRHNIPGARKRRDRRHGPRKPTGWTLTHSTNNIDEDRWSHPDGREFVWSAWSCGWQSPANLFVDMTRHLGKGASHPARFREQLPF